MIKRIIFALAFLILIPLSLSAQKNKEDVVHLKNGSIIRGSIVEIKVDEYVKIEIAGGSVFYYSMNEVASITKEPAFKENKGEYNYQDKGYFNETGFSLLFGRDYSTYYSSNEVSIEFHTVNGYQFFPYLKAGLGVGIDYYSSYDFILSPVYLRVGGSVFQKPVTPFYYIDFGYGFAWDSGNEFYKPKGGWMYSPGIGIKFNSRSAVAYMINLSYRNQQAEIQRSDGWAGGVFTTNYKFNRLALGFSVVF